MAVADVNNIVYIQWISHLEGCLKGNIPSRTHGYIILKLCEYISKLLKFRQIHLNDTSRKNCGPFLLSYMKYKLLTTGRTFYETAGFKSEDDQEDKFRTVVQQPVKEVISRELLQDPTRAEQVVSGHLLSLHAAHLKSTVPINKPYPRLHTRHNTLNEDVYRSLIHNYVSELMSHPTQSLYQINQKLIKDDCIYAVIIDGLLSRERVLFVKFITDAYKLACDSKWNMFMDLN